MATTTPPARAYAVIPRLDPLVTAPYVDLDEERYGEEPSGKWLEVRDAAAIAGSGSIVGSRLRVAPDIPEAERIDASYIGWEQYYDVRVRYRDDAAMPHPGSTLAAAAAAGDTVIKYTGQTWAVGERITVWGSSGSAEDVRVITAVGTSGTGGTGLTLDEPLLVAHADGDSIEAHVWGSPSPWATFKVSQPPTVNALAPTDGALVNDPTTGITYTYSSPSAKPNVSSILRVYERAGGIDRLIWSGAVTIEAAEFPTFLLHTGRTYAWEVEAFDSDGLSDTTGRLTLTTSFGTPQAVTDIAWTADVEASAIVLTWAEPFTDDFESIWDHYRVYRRLVDRSWVRVDGGPVILDDGRPRLAVGVFTDYGATLGENEYAVTAHTGAADLTGSEGAPANIEATLPAARLGYWMRVIPGEALHTYPLRIEGTPRKHEAIIDHHVPPGGEPLLVKWGRAGVGVEAQLRHRPSEDGDVSTVLALEQAEHMPGWLKAPEGWRWDPIWSEVTDLTDRTTAGGLLDIRVTFDEVRRV